MKKLSNMLFTNSGFGDKLGRAGASNTRNARKGEESDVPVGRADGAVERSRSIRGRVPRGSLSGASEPARGGSGRLAGALRRLGDGPLRARQRRVAGSGDVLLAPRCGTDRF